MNLTTPCTQLKFNCTGEILATCSSYAENALKLVTLFLFIIFYFAHPQEQMFIKKKKKIDNA